MIYYGSNDYRDYLAHHGVVGMHWGIRRYQPYSVKPRGSGKGGKFVGDGTSDRRAQLKAKKKDAYDAKKNVKLLSDEELSRRVKRFENERKLKQYTDESYAPKRTATKKAVSRVLTSLSNATLKTASKAAAAVIVPVAIAKLSPHAKKIAEKATPMIKNVFTNLHGNAGSSSTIDDMRAKEAMRHTKEVTKQAKKDAAEYAKARVRTGEGAGNRRKLINMQIQERSKDPEYKKAFDEYSKKQNYVKLSDQERRRSTAVKTAEALKRNAKRAVAVTATAATVAFYLNQMGMLEPIIDKIKR